jgi:hypothetical protein
VPHMPPPQRSSLTVRVRSRNPDACCRNSSTFYNTPCTSYADFTQLQQVSSGGHNHGSCILRLTLLWQLPPATFRANFSDDWKGCSVFAEAEWWVLRSCRGRGGVVLVAVLHEDRVLVHDDFEDGDDVARCAPAGC